MFTTISQPMKLAFAFILLAMIGLSSASSKVAAGRAARHGQAEKGKLTQTLPKITGGPTREDIQAATIAYGKLGGYDEKPPENDTSNAVIYFAMLPDTTDA